MWCSRACRLRTRRRLAALDNLLSVWPEMPETEPMLRAARVERAELLSRIGGEAA
jgi:hypothetical protein